MCLFYNSIWFLVSFIVSFYIELSSILDLPICDSDKTLNRELEFSIHFVSLNPPSDNNFVKVTTISFAISIFL